MVLSHSEKQNKGQSKDEYIAFRRSVATDS